MFARIAGIIAIMVGLIAGLATTATALDQPNRWEVSRTICVESRMGSGWTSEDEAFRRLDAAFWYIDYVIKNGVGSCDGYDQTIEIHKVDRSDKGRAWISYTTVFKTDNDGNTYGAYSHVRIYMNVNSKFSRTWRQNVATFMHEGYTGTGKPVGDDWEGHSTPRCDSIASLIYECMVSHDGPTDFDKAEMARVYKDWRTFNLGPLSD